MKILKWGTIDVIAGRLSLDGFEFDCEGAGYPEVDGHVDWDDLRFQRDVLREIIINLTTGRRGENSTATMQ